MSTVHSDIFSTNRTESAGRLLNPVWIAQDIWRRRDLLWQFTVRDVEGRYKGSYLGLVWAILNPLLMLAVFTLVFHGLFHQHLRPNDPNENFLVYARYLFSGMIAFNIFSESVNKAPLLITQNPNYVKKVVFPLEILPLSVIGSSLFHGFLSLLVLLVVAGLGNVAPHWTLLYLPIVCIPLLLMTAGLCWLLSSLGVFLRDIGQFISVAVQLLFFLTPITWTLAAVIGPTTPHWVTAAVWINPLVPVIESFRRVVNDGEPPTWGPLMVVTVLGLVMAAGGYAWFMKIKRAFADVI